MPTMLASRLLSMVAATVWSGWFLKWNTNRNAPLGDSIEPSQSPSSSFDTAGLAGISSTFASPVRLNSTGSEHCGLEIVPFILPSEPKVSSNGHPEFDGDKLHGLAVYRHIHHDKAGRVFGGKAHTGDPLRFRVLRQVERQPGLAIVHRKGAS